MSLVVSMFHPFAAVGRRELRNKSMNFVQFKCRYEIAEQMYPLLVGHIMLHIRDKFRERQH